MMQNFSPKLNDLSTQFSGVSISRLAKIGFNFRVDIRQIRRSNMLTLIEREKTQAAFAAKVGTVPAYISQILSPKTKAEIGNDLARAIEVAYALPHGWMDREHWTAEQPVAEYEDFAAAWKLLLPEERAALMVDIQSRADHNKAVREMAAAENEGRPAPKMPATAVTAGPPTVRKKPHHKRKTGP